MQYGAFGASGRSYDIVRADLPRPWINYLGNRSLRAFVSHNAGGLLWLKEPYSRRITRYHYTAAPGDQPGFYLYVRDRKTEQVWNPHAGPSFAALDAFRCSHRPGITSFLSCKDGVEVQFELGIPPGDDVLLWLVTVRNRGEGVAAVDVVSYMEFGLLEFMREALGWCYLKNQFALRYDEPLGAIRYDYHVFEAPYTPYMLFGGTEPASGWACSRDAFIGKTGTYALPDALREPGFPVRADLPLGGHACAALGVEARLPAGGEKRFGFCFAVAPERAEAEALLGKYRQVEAIGAGLQAIDAYWSHALGQVTVATGDAVLDSMINTWIPYNSMVALDLARTVSTDHMGVDGLRFRDSMQDALAVTGLDPDFAHERILQVLSRQTAEGGGCYAFYPDDGRAVRDEPVRSDNTVWPVYTVYQYLAETGDESFLDQSVPFRSGDEASVYEHLLRGLRFLAGRRGLHGLPMLYHADWNDGLALFQDEAAESVMLGMQLVYAARLFRTLAERSGRHSDGQWCGDLIDELSGILNSDLVWDGRWYRRLLLSNGKVLGSAANRQGRIYLNPQSWSVISGVGDREGRGRVAMEAVAELLDSDAGVQILAPPFVGIPEPEDPPLGSNPGIGENGGIFCHANTWAIMAECLLGNGDRAWKYFRQMLPPVVSERFGAAHYEREPYVFVSSIIGPVSDRFGVGGISWLTGTANWMHVAILQYMLGIRPTLDGTLDVKPCLPAERQGTIQVERMYRGRKWSFTI